jgi:hypothetical protein
LFYEFGGSKTKQGKSMGNGLLPPPLGDEKGEGGWDFEK